MFRQSLVLIETPVSLCSPLETKTYLYQSIHPFCLTFQSPMFRREGDKEIPEPFADEVCLVTCNGIGFVSLLFNPLNPRIKIEILNCPLFISYRSSREKLVKFQANLV